MRRIARIMDRIPVGVQSRTQSVRTIPTPTPLVRTIDLQGLQRAEWMDLQQKKMGKH